MRLCKTVWTVFVLGVLIPWMTACADEEPGVRSLPSREKRVALVIGNNDYSHVTRLRNAVADAQAIRQELGKFGFEVLFRQNVNRKEMNKAIDEFLGKMSSDVVALLFYAGHGVQIKSANYLLPVDIDAQGENDLVHDSIDMATVQDRMSEAGAKFSLVILDACRDNPFKGTASRSIVKTRGLAVPSSNATGIMVVYSAGANQQAIDQLDAGDKDPNGLFTREFLKAMRKPGMKVQDVVSDVRQTVIEKAKAVGYLQTPAIYDQSVGTFFFAPPGDSKTAAAPAMSSTLADRETVFWQSAKESPEGCRAYLSQYPQGEYAALARLCGDKRKPGNEMARNVEEKNVPASAEKKATLQATAPPSPGEWQVTDESQPQARQEGKVMAETESFLGEFVRVPGGTLAMGCGAWQAECEAWEKPVQKVTVAAFEIGKHEVTQKEWQSVMGENPSRFNACGEDCPVEQVSWLDAQQFIARLNARGKESYRLPTEAEWEYACRSAGKPERYCGGQEASQVAWHHGNSGGKTHPGGKKSPNGLGIADMSGNVWEWTCSEYGTYDKNRNFNRCSDSGSHRVLRGGGWDDPQTGARSSERGSAEPGFKNVSLGLRLVRESRPAQGLEK